MWISLATWQNLLQWNRIGGQKMKEKLTGLIKQFLKFGVVGVIAFFIDYGVLLILSEGFGVYYLIANAISFTVSVIFNYICSMKFVFTGKEGMSKHKEFIIFVILSVLGLLLNELLMWVGVDICHIYSMITKIFATAIVMVYNFITRKIFLEE
jgi:putative flippase GtrA